jgi:hypothetical protein
MALPAETTAEIDTALAGLGDRAPPRFDARDFPLPGSPTGRRLPEGLGSSCSSCSSWWIATFKP